MPTTGRKFGDMGEQIAASFLVNKGYRIIDRNYQRPWGEIDIVARKKKLLIFCEVKTRNARNVNHHLPEQSVNAAKVKKLHKICRSYLYEMRLSDNQSWRIDVLSVIIDMGTKKARVRHFENAIWESQY